MINLFNKLEEIKNLLPEAVEEETVEEEVEEVELGEYITGEDVVFPVKEEVFIYGYDVFEEEKEKNYFFKIPDFKKIKKYLIGSKPIKIYKEDYIGFHFIEMKFQKNNNIIIVKKEIPHGLCGINNNNIIVTINNVNIFEIPVENLTLF